MRVRVPLAVLYAEVAKLADAPDLGSGSSMSAGSSPVFGIKSCVILMVVWCG